MEFEILKSSMRCSEHFNRHHDGVPDETCKTVLTLRKLGGETFWNESLTLKQIKYWCDCTQCHEGYLSPRMWLRLKNATLKLVDKRGVYCVKCLLKKTWSISL